MVDKSIENSEGEIDLLELFKIVWNGRKTVFRFVIIFGLIGLFIAVFSEKEYTASTTVVLQTGKKNIGSNLGGLAAIAGVNLGGGSTESIPPALYPKIVQSIPFQKELLKVSLQFSHVKKVITYKEYYEEYKKNNVLSVIKSYTIGLPSKVLSLFKKKQTTVTEIGIDSICRISVEENMLFKQLESQLVIDINSKEGVIEISFSMPEALPSAQMTKKVQELLQKSITNFKIQKSQEEFKFIEERYNEVKKDFVEKQALLASFRDRNQRLITARSQSRKESLQSEYNLAYGIYSELAKQLETQKIKLKENTPVFTVIEPVTVPVTRSKPKKVVILAIWIILGVFLGVVLILGKKFIVK